MGIFCNQCNLVARRHRNCNDLKHAPDTLVAKAIMMTLTINKYILQISPNQQEQCPPIYIDNSQLIYKANQLDDFFIIRILVYNWLINILSF